MRKFFTLSSHCFTLLFAITSLSGYSQLIVNTNATATQLANEIVGAGVTISNVNLQSAAEGTGIFSNGSSTNIGISNGILLTTGDALDAIGPNNQGNTSKDKADFAADPDIDALTNYTIKDQCILEFDFVAQSNYINVQYVFASEEYNEWVCTQYNDMFGFFVNGPNPSGGNYSGVNVALVPGTTLPVSINTINNGTAGSHGNPATCQSLAYANLYQYNTPGATIGYDGFTVTLTAELNIVPGQSYHFKFAIADLSDGLWDSGIFIKADSFSVFDCEAGNLNFSSTPPTLCADDTVNDVVQVTTSSLAPSDTYKYFITNSSGQILAINTTGTFDLSSYGVGSFKIYGISTDGIVSGFTVGNNISMIAIHGQDGCFEMTSPLTVSRNNCKPVLLCPANVNLACQNAVPAPNPGSVQVSSQFCAGGSVVWLSDTPTGTGCNGSLTRTYRLQDNCGFVGQCQQTFSYHDIIAPVISAAGANSTINCGVAPSFTPPTATDNCGTATINVVSDVTTPGACPGTYTRTITWKATDACGNNSNNVSQSITVIDTTAPVIAGLPANANVLCSAMPIGSNYAVTATDACDASVTITSTFVDVNVGCNKQRTITWTATDDCGNTSTASRVFTSGDNIAPVMFGVPTNATMQCGQPVPDAVVSATDNCDASPVVSMNATTVPATCGYSLVRTWTATDACGNISTASQTTTFVDTTNPVLVGVPAATSVNCGTVPDGEDFDVTATDNCVNAVTVTSSYVDAGSGCNMTRTITWTATDACGNHSSASRTFTLSDTSAPVLAGLPQDATVACGALPDGDDFAVFANDNCDPTVSIVFAHVDASSGCNVARTITWTATDDCGNTSSASRTFTSSDAIAPQLIGVPTNATMQCGQPVPDAVVSAIDNCDASPVVSMNATTVPATCGYSLVRTWTATDACGNSSTASQTTTFVDTTNPVLVGVPAATSVNCGTVPDGEDFDVTATDNCVNAVTVTSSYVDAGSGCNMTRTITWTATDACGNHSSASRTFTLSDTSAPVLAGLPQNATVACGALPDGDDFAVFANDNCDPTVTIIFAHVDASSGCNVARTITWTATDDCGNTSSASRTFTSSDAIAPQLIGVPTNATMQCGQPVPDAVVSAIDNCDASPVVSMNATTVPATCGYSLVRTWTATDACGNSSTASQTTTFVDTTNPVLVGVPANATVNCGAIPDGDDFNVTASDNCVNEVTVTSSIADVGSGCNITRTITWTATDACGNHVSASRTFTTNDTTAPVLTGIPENGSVLCGGLPSTTEYNVNATDNCDQDVTIAVVANDVGSGCNVIRTITWTATDDCGNHSSATRTFTTQDNIAPTLIGVPENATMQCGEPVPAAVVSAIDNCDTQPVVSMNATTVPATCGYSLVRTWTATDACGNSSTASQTTTFVDTTNPVLVGVPEATSVNCGTVPDGEDFDVTATDNCVNAVTVTSSYVDAGSGCNMTRTITWTATDACGNHSSASRTFSLSDNAAPVLAGLPQNATVACGALPEGDDFAVFANDNCDPTVSIIFTHVDASSGCNVERTITWTATDACGNTSSASRTFTSSDAIAPQLIGVPTNATMQCGQPVPDAVVSAIDNCDASPVVSMNATTVPATCGYSLVRTWTATDACGNSSTASQTTTFVDTTNPVLVGVPEATSVNCGTVPDGEDFDVTATDNCVNAVTVTSSYVDAGSGCNMTRTITWTATDACGNHSSASRTFTLSDTSAPVLAGLPQDATVACGALPEGDDFAVFANDNCDPTVTIIFAHVDASSGCNVARTITWTATDDCGNTSSASRTFTSSDAIAPQLIGVPTNATMQCGQPVPDAVVSAIDNCDASPVVSMNATTVPATCGYSLVRTWTATDACGNSSTASQTTTFVDTTNPVLVGVPANATVNCGAIPDGDDFNVTATDNCVNEVTVTSSIADVGSGCNITRTITWTATDACGNHVSASRTFTTNDTTAPVLTGIPENGSVLCGGLPSTTEYNVNATDNCDQDVTIAVVANDVGSGCNVIRTITWTATDDCGNHSSATRTFTTQDNIAPSLIGVPEDATMQCGEPVPAAVVSAIDNCDTQPVVSMNATTVPATCGYSLVLTWTATDACGNISTASQTTTFVDTTNPVLVGVPEATSVNCGTVPDGEDFDVTATDNCVNAVTVTSSYVDAGSGCNMTRTITWTATDACGNHSSASRTFTLSDTSAPVLAGLPQDATVACGALPDGDDFAVFANDNCDPTVSIIFTHVDASSGCNVERTITWTATDACGNTSSASRTFTSSDSIEPTLIGVPADATMQCGEAVPDALVSAMDNCSSELNVSLSANTIPNECGYSLVRTWSVVDDCGNTASASQTTTFIDTTIPVLHNVPHSMTVACISLPSGDDYDITATDNCDQNILVTSSSVDSGNGCNIIRTITWSATDACGNMATATRTFSTSDLLPPSLTNLPESATVACSDMPEGGNFDVGGEDDCDASVTVTSTFTDEESGCNRIRTITWTATDDCGNSVSASRVFTSYDDVAPILLGVPENLDLPIGSAVPQAMVEALDNCDFVPIITLNAVTTDTPCGQLFVRTWTAYDACGNSSTATQTINFTSSEPPTLHGVPAEQTVGCSALPVAEDFEVYATDHQNNTLEVTSSVSDFGIGCGMFRTITWSVTDACGYVASESRTFSLSGDVPPVLHGVPSNLSLACTALVPDAVVTASDQCNNSINVFMDEVMTVGCPYTITRTWSAVDGCGNETTATQVITIFDQVAPVIHGDFEDLTYECHNVIEVNEVTATDNCDDDVTITLNSQVQAMGCGQIITKTWTATDECGNTSTASQTIYIVDETGPVFSSNPQNITVSCGNVPPAPELSATDNCDTSVNITFSETNMGGACPQMIKRVWTATDDCGNSTTAVQIVTVIDNIAPVFVNLAPSIQLECDAVASYHPVATDNCTQNLTVNIISETSLPGTCYGNIQRTYAVTDNCGNTTTATQLIVVVDNTPPSIYNVPFTTVIQCGEAIPPVAENVTAHDNCDQNVSLQFHQSQSGTSCPYTITRMWVATDLCGNSTTQTQIITVINPVASQAYFRAYPNPAASGRMKIQFSVAYDTKVSGVILDASGREVLTLMNDIAMGAYVYEWSTELQKLAPGTYFVKMNVNGEIYNKKIDIISR